MKKELFACMGSIFFFFFFLLYFISITNSTQHEYHKERIALDVQGGWSSNQIKEDLERSVWLASTRTTMLHWWIQNKKPQTKSVLWKNHARRQWSLGSHSQIAHCSFNNESGWGDEQKRMWWILSASSLEKISNKTSTFQTPFKMRLVTELSIKGRGRESNLKVNFLGIHWSL